MENILNNIDELIDIITNSELYKEYINIENKMKNNNELMSLIEEIKRVEQKIVKDKYNKKDVKELESKFSILEDRLNSYPIYIDFIDKQEELNNIFLVIKNNLNSYFDNL